jgi:CBS domain-containing protein
LSERDIVRKLAETPGQTLPQTVAENMTSKVETCTPTDALVSAVQELLHITGRRFPIMAED